MRYLVHLEIDVSTADVWGGPNSLRNTDRRCVVRAAEKVLFIITRV